MIDALMDDTNKVIIKPYEEMEDYKGEPIDQFADK
jgi:hypothetical protein